MITGVAFCPHPPVLVPEVAGAAAPELDGLRAACHHAIKQIATPPTPIAVIGCADATATYQLGTRGSLAGYGVDVDVALGSGSSAFDESDSRGPVVLPLSLTIGAWLLAGAVGGHDDIVGLAVASRAEPAADVIAAFGARDVALLVMGDASATRSPTAPGGLDGRAADFDTSVARAMSGGRPQDLLTDVGLGDELMACGPRVWNAAAAVMSDSVFDAELLYDSAPYGVGYLVAVWT